MESEILATEIVKKLVHSGYTAYFAGGWVRDHIMGNRCEDIDIATDAPPEKILSLFPRTLLVGLAFGVIIVVMDGHQFEVSTFRRDINYVNGRKPEQIELATPREDASRRDFTINGMFYDPLEKMIYDYVGGVQDLNQAVIRTIGDPYERFSEDRLRMIRAVRFSARFGFSIDPLTREAIQAHANTLFPAVAIERVWQEMVKMSKSPRFEQALLDLHRLELLPTIFPELKGVHLNQIKAIVKNFKFYPKAVEAILSIMALFPHADEEKAKELCRYLHTSNAEMALALFLVRGKSLVNLEQQMGAYDKVSWAHFYANPHSSKCLEVIAASMEEGERVLFLAKHQRRRQDLCFYIERIANKNPLVNAALLQQHGIAPGKLMGALLKEAEALAIELNLEEGEGIVTVLKNSRLWPQ